MTSLNPPVSILMPVRNAAKTLETLGLNSDDSIKRLKGESRPVNNEKTRYEILKSISYIDEVIVFNEDTPINLIKEISPDILIKGNDYLEEEIVGADFVKKPMEDSNAKK